MLPQEADDERGERNVSDELQHDTAKNVFFPHDRLSRLAAAYLAAVNAACERAPMIFPRAVSDGQFYSPPESVAGDVSSSLWLCSCFIRLCVCA